MMKRTILLSTLMILGCLHFAFITASATITSNDDELGYLPANCEEPINFEITSQEPCEILKANPDTGQLSLLDRVRGLCGTYNDNPEEDRKIKVHYNVTSSDGVTRGNFIIIDLEEEE